MPAPERATETEVSDALELSTRVAFADPATVGEKVTERLALLPAANVYGKESPLTLKPVPLMLAAEIVRLEAPVFDRVRDCVWVLPTVTLPRFILEGALRYPGVGFVPEPERVTPTEASDAFEVSARVAPAEPAVVGAKRTDKVVLIPAAKVYGKETPPTLKPAPVTLAAEIVRLDPPEFDRVSACDWLLPTITLPRFILEELTPK